ncbi:putative ATP synthase subunit f, mitochondrial, partial [Fragariocoptes setiger]
MPCSLFGNYPVEYNRKIHGPFYPWVNYGKRDTPLNEVKLGELTQWLKRRDMTPQAMTSSISRVVNYWQHKWIHPRYGSYFAACCHVFIISSFVSMLNMYGYLKTHRNHKYHW